MKRESWWRPKQCGWMAKGRGLVDMWVWNGRNRGYGSTSRTSGNAGIFLWRLDSRGCKSGMGSTCTSWNPICVLQRDGSRPLHRMTGSRMQAMIVRLRRPSKMLRWEWWAQGQTWSRNSYLGCTGDARLEKCDRAWALDWRCRQLDGRWSVTFRKINDTGQTFVEPFHTSLCSVKSDTLYKQRSSLGALPSRLIISNHFIYSIFNKLKLSCFLFLFTSFRIKLQVP